MSTVKFDQAEVHYKKWGKEIWIANNQSYCGKILEFKEGANFSMHFHIKKEESWYVVEGEFLLEYFDYQNAVRQSKKLFAGDVVHIERNALHKLTAVTRATIIEVSTQHFEDDSYRIEASNAN